MRILISYSIRKGEKRKAVGGLALYTYRAILSGTMANEHILEQILEHIKGVGVKVANVETKVTSIDTRLTGVETKVTSIDDKLSTLQAKVIDMDHYMKENLVTREEFNEKIDELYTHVDGFATLQTRLDQEVVALRSKYERLERQ